MKRFFAVLCSLLVACGAGLAFVKVNSAEAAAKIQPSVPYPTLEQVTNFDFMLSSYRGRGEEGEHPKLVFGSSELNPEPAGSGHPVSLFADGRYGMSVMPVGRAFCIDLWQAIEAGAFASEMDDKRAVIIPSMQWFMCYRDPQKDFKASFSQGAFDAFMANDDISAETKRAVVNRMAEYGVNRKSSLISLRDESSSKTSEESPGEIAATVSEALLRPVDAIDEAAKSMVDGVRLKLMMDWRKDSESSEGSLEAVSSSEEEGKVDADPKQSSEESSEDVNAATPVQPDWDAVFMQAESEAKASSKNKIGVYDSWYKKSYEKWVKGAKSRWGFSKDGPFSPQEFDDFKLILRVCKEAGIRPLVLIQPANGRVYDQTIYNKEVRAQYYDMIRDACKDAGVEVADFSGHEYDKHFLRDHSHPSSLGGAYYSKAIYNFFMKEE